MDNRKQNEDLPIVFGGVVTATIAAEKLENAKVGSFLIRESSVEGLISVSCKNKSKIQHFRFALTPGKNGELEWEAAPVDVIAARETAAKAKKAFAHIKEHPESLNSLMELLKSHKLDFNKIIKPEIKTECSEGYSGYTFNSYHSDVNIKFKK